MKFKLTPRKGLSRTMDAGDDPTYEEWLSRVDRLVWAGAGLSLHDLPDRICLRDLYDARVRPIRAAAKAVRAA